MSEEEQGLMASRDHAPTTGGARAEGGEIYVASRASVPERSAMWRFLRDRGEPIISTWIDEAAEGETESNTELWGRILGEITRASSLILYVEPDDFPLKGALIEVGMALALEKPVYVVAPDVKLSIPAMRPLGSWAAHSGVTFAETVQDALDLATHDTTDRQPHLRDGQND